MNSLYNQLRKDLHSQYNFIVPITYLLNENKIPYMRLQKGGEGKLYKIKLDQDYYFRTIKFIDEERIDYTFVSVDDKSSCAILIKDKDVGLIQAINVNNKCIVDKNGNSIAKVGTNILLLLIEYAKYKGLRKITASDNAHYHSEPGKSIELKILHTLLYGKPWYYKFDFKFTNKENDEIVTKNYEHFLKLKLKDIPDKYIKKEYNGNLEEHISNYFRWLSNNDINNLYLIYYKVYIDLGFSGYNSGNGHEMVLELRKDISIVQ